MTIKWNTRFSSEVYDLYIHKFLATKNVPHRSFIMENGSTSNQNVYDYSQGINVIIAPMSMS